MSIVKGARNLDNAKKFVDWALTPKAQALGAQAKQFQLPSNTTTPISPLSPKPADIKLINYDFAKYGASAERKRLLERWDREVGSQPADVIVGASRRSIGGTRHASRAR